MFSEFNTKVIEKKATQVTTNNPTAWYLINRHTNIGMNRRDIMEIKITLYNLHIYKHNIQISIKFFFFFIKAHLSQSGGSGDCLLIWSVAGSRTVGGLDAALYISWPGIC